MSLATTMITALSLQLITCFLLLTTTTSSPHGFTIDLTERRTKPSSLGPSNTDGGSPYSDVIFDSVDYLMKLEIGTPPVEIEAILDTGSEVVWTQCLPCVSCYDEVGPIFDPSKSSTYKQKKPYDVVYGDTSYSKGNLASETVTLRSTSGQPFVMPETIIGCGHNNLVKYIAKPAKFSGIVGLNMGALSLISQMGEDESLGLFSYCLSSKETSKINFGGNAIVAGDTVSIDIFRNEDNPELYYLNLDAISADGNKVETLGTKFHSSKGNIFIDSGTTLTYLPDPFCSQVSDLVEILMSSSSAPRSSSPGLCYDTYDIEIFPVITMHFSGGADLVLGKRNMFRSVHQGTYCLAIKCVDPKSGTAIFGSVAHNDFLVGYDLSSQLISFKPTNCSALWS